MRTIARASGKSAGDRAIAEALDQGGFRPSFKSRLGEPRRKLGDLDFGHRRIIAGAGRKTKGSISGARTTIPLLKDVGALSFRRAIAI